MGGGVRVGNFVDVAILSTISTKFEMTDVDCEIFMLDVIPSIPWG